MNNFEYFNQYIKNKIPSEVGLKYSNDTNGLFGSLQRVEFESQTRIGGVDFWSSGWINMHLVDTVKGNELINILLEPNKKEKVYDAFDHMLELISRN